MERAYENLARVVAAGEADLVDGRPADAVKQFKAAIDAWYAWKPEDDPSFSGDPYSIAQQLMPRLEGCTVHESPADLVWLYFRMALAQVRARDARAGRKSLKYCADIVLSCHARPNGLARLRELAEIDRDTVIGALQKLAAREQRAGHTGRAAEAIAALAG